MDVKVVKMLGSLYRDVRRRLCSGVVFRYQNALTRCRHSGHSGGAPRMLTQNAEDHASFRRTPDGLDRFVSYAVPLCAAVAEVAFILDNAVLGLRSFLTAIA